MKIIRKLFRPRVCGLLLGFVLSALSFLPSKAQVSTAQDVQQLILDIEKLTQFKAILSDLEQGYTILTQGYGMVRDISQGNFNLHSAFLNSLMAVSPEIKRYGRIADIIADQASIVSEYKSAWRQATGSGHFNANELAYINNVFQHLLKQSIDNLGNLTNVITAGSMRMSDADRLQAIDHIYSDTQNKLVFLRHFNTQVAVLELQRQKAADELQSLKNLF